MALSLFWRCEGTALDATHDFSAGDTSAALGSAAAINSDAALFGTNGLDCPTGSDRAIFAITANDILSPAEGCVGLWARVTTFVDQNSLWFSAGTLGSDFVGLFLSGSDELNLMVSRSGSGDVQLTTSGANLATGTWYFIACRWKDSTNSRRIEVYNTSLSLLYSLEDTSTDFAVPVNLTEFRVGETQGGASDIHIDNVFASLTYAEAIQNDANITSYTQYGGTDTPLAVDKGDITTSGSSATFALAMGIASVGVAPVGQAVGLVWQQDTLTISVVAATPSIVGGLIDGRRGTPVLHGVPTISGSVVNLQLSETDFMLAVETGTPTIAPQAIVLEDNRAFSYAIPVIAPQAIPLRIGSPVTSAAVAFTGSNVTLTPSVGISVAVESGVPVIAPQDVSLNWIRSITVDSTALDIDGSNVGFNFQVTNAIVVDPAAFSILGKTANLDRGIIVESTALFLAGQSVTRSWGTNVFPATRTISGSEIGLSYTFTLGIVVDRAVPVLTGGAVTLFLGGGEPTRARITQFSDSIRITLGAPITVASHSENPIV